MNITEHLLCGRRCESNRVPGQNNLRTIKQV